MTAVIYAILVVVLYAIWLLTIRAGAAKLSCQRRFSRVAAFPGEEGELIEIVRNDSPFIVPWLRMECRVAPQVHLGRQDNLYAGEEYYGSLFTLMPYQQIRRSHPVKFLRRGACDLGRVSITAGDVLGLVQLRRKQELSAPVLVYPRLLGDDAIPVPMSRMLGELTSRRQLQEDPFLVRGIRAYRPGDPVRDIHWPATARTGEAQVRVRDYSARTRLLVVLNTQKEQDQWHDLLEEADEQIVEYGISLAATVCVRALRSGLAAGFAANMSTDGTIHNTLLLPADGVTQEEALLSTMARLQIRRTRDFCFLLHALARQTDLDIVVLSMYESPDMTEAMARLRRAGNQVYFHRLEGGGV